MTSLFRSRIKASLEDANLQSALDANAQRRIKVRKEAFATLSDPEGLRALAHAIRADVIDHLESYLQEFIAHVSANGIIVHQAADAGQAIQQVLAISEQHAARQVAKSKTMVSEEIDLNQALEQQGLQVVETDLGEYIVQLRGEHPSHIITPAVHLKRQDVGRLFEEKLGLPYTEDISVMTNVARRTLRQVFLEADIGISGVNFGVAETGTLCLVTNEGNGRMVTTVPKVHIALMGIERLLPNMTDLALMLSLLPRSATGQKLSVYTSLIKSPRQTEDPDGPVERHLILVDNGRRIVQTSGLQEILYCIRCGACLNACPVFREIGGHAYVDIHGKGSPYPGPIGSVVSPALFGQCEYGQLARASSLCGACREACPVDIDLPKLLLRVRAGTQANQDQPVNKPNAPLVLAFGLKLYTLAASSPWRFAFAQRLASWFGALATIFSRGDPWMKLPGFTGWGYSKDFPRPALQPFHSRIQKPVRAFKQTEQNFTLPVGISTTKIGIEPSAPIQLRQGKEAFAAELTAVGGNFITCQHEQAAEKVLEILRTRGITQVLAWDANNLPFGILGKLEQNGIGISYPTGEMVAQISKERAGITGVTAAIAETGSLVLVGGAGKPLTASLLPEVHIALLFESQIVESLDQVLQYPEIQQASAAVVITGPSRTADIEMTLTIGVHGPGELHVICLIDA